MRTILVAAAAAFALSLAAAGSASALITPGSLTVDSGATLSPNGRAIVVTGSVQCDAGQRVRVTANPMSGEPDAVGKTAFECSGAAQDFSLTVRMKGNGLKFSDINTVQLFVRASTTDGDVESDTVDVSWP